MSHNLGMDIGTMFVVGATPDKGGTVVTRKRNCFILIKGNPFNKRMYTDNPDVDWMPWEDGQIALIGDSALEYANSNPTALEIRRPLAHGILNKDEKDAYPMLRAIVESTAGKVIVPPKGTCTLSIPAPTIDCEYLIDHHRDVLFEILKQLGWEVQTIHEGYCVILSALAKSKFTGIGISFGGGMVNVSFSFMADELFAFSMQQSGDWIDLVASDASRFSRAEITDMKESGFSLDNDNIGKDGLWQIQSAYTGLIEATVANINVAFSQLEKPPRVKDPLPVVVSGGTSMVPGFVKLFEEKFRGSGFPVPIGDVIHAKDPLYAVAKGALLHATTIGPDSTPEEAPVEKSEEVPEEKGPPEDEPSIKEPDPEATWVDCSCGHRYDSAFLSTCPECKGTGSKPETEKKKPPPQQFQVPQPPVGFRPTQKREDKT